MLQIAQAHLISMRDLNQSGRSRVRFDISATGMAIATVDGHPLVAVPVPRDQIPAAISALVGDLGVPTRVEVHDSGGIIGRYLVAPETTSQADLRTNPLPSTGWAGHGGHGSAGCCAPVPENAGESDEHQ